MKKLVAVAALLANSAWAAEVGDELKDVALKTADEKPATVPGLGEKILALFYTDADVPDLNDAFADGLKNMKPNLAHYQGVGVANLNDSKAPNFIIRSVIRGKIEKYKSTIVTDPDNSLSKAWGLGDCNNTAVILVIGKDKKVKFVQKGAVKGADLERALAMVKQLVSEAEAVAAPAAPTPAAPQ